MSGQADAVAMIAQSMPELADGDVESELLSLDMLVGLSGGELVMLAAAALRAAASRCADPRRQRVLAAAAAIERGEPCALTEDGLTWQEAGKAHTISLEQWQKQEAAEAEAVRSAAPPAMPRPDLQNPAPAEPTPGSIQVFVPRQPAPAMPQLPARHFFPGLRLRIDQAFRDLDAEYLAVGLTLQFVAQEFNRDGRTRRLTFLQRVIRLSEAVPEQALVAENAGNAWFQPMPTWESLQQLWEEIDRHWRARDLSLVAGAAQIRADIDACGTWLRGNGQGGPAPDCSSAPGAAAGLDDDALAFWIPLLFRGVNSPGLAPERPR